MKKLLVVILCVSPCLGGDPVIPRAALQPVQVVMLAGIVAAQVHPDPVVLVDRPKAKNVQPKKYAREQKTQKFPKNYHVDNKTQSRR